MTGDPDSRGAPLGERGTSAGTALLAEATLVRRSPLLERLAGVGTGTVTLVCAPAGSGKTILVRSWVEGAGLEDRIAWVSVERDERDAQRFWLAVADALAQAGGIAAKVDPAPRFRGDALVEKLLADLGSLEEPAALVIDDLHELRSPDALHWLELLLGASPPELRVVLVTREEPRIGLSRLRLAGRLAELDGSDLRFTQHEAADMLSRAGLALSEENVAELWERTEGWAAGLRLAALSLQHHPDPQQFVREFSGSERTVARYLLEEVLERQPPEVRELLLRTSILDRVCGPLADRLTESTGSERMLQELDDANAFVTAIDVGRTWFRYHHLFADMLRLELRNVAAGLLAPLHRGAAAWHEQHGDVVEAIRHAQAAEDWDDAIRLLSGAHIGLILDGRMATVRALLDAFPAGVGAEDPALALVFTDLRLREGAGDDAGAYLAAAERRAETVAAQDRAGFDLRLASARLEAASRRGELERAREAMVSLETALAKQTASGLEQSNDIHALALVSLGTAELWALQLEDARAHLEAGLALARRIARPYLEIGCLADLAIAAPLSGMTAPAALHFAEQAIAVADAHGLGTDPVATLSFAIGAGTLAWLGRFEESEHWLGRTRRALRPDESPGIELAAHHARGLLRLGQGRFADALEAFSRAEKMQTMLAREHALSGDLRMRIVLTQVRTGEIRRARERLERVTDEERDRADVRLPAAAIELAEERPEQAIELLAPVAEQTAPTPNPVWAAIDALLLEAVAHTQLRDPRAKEEALERALALAEPQGLILPFAIAPVEDLLRAHPGHRTAHGTFIAEVLDVLAGGSPGPRGEEEPLLEELSEAELRVARYLPTNLKAPEIASELFISTNTVRTHLRHIYAKLGVHGRGEAVARARALGLLGPSSRRL